jgi:hypothetical protein
MGFLRCARSLPLLAGALALMLCAAALASAQNPPLAEVARKEQERRKALTGATKVLTNKDLPKVTNPAPGPPAGVDGQKPEPAASQTPPEPAAQGQDQEPPGPVRDEGWWRARITGARDQLARDEVLLEALQVRVSGLNYDFASRDESYQRMKVGEDRQRAIVERDRIQTEIADLKKKIEDIEEEARKAAVPPGWLR